jgi:hypothetical protein
MANMMSEGRTALRHEKLELYRPFLQSSRASRFSVRVSGRPPLLFAELMQTPAWVIAQRDENYRITLIRMAALLHFRPQIDREISGARLQLLAQEFGEDMLDAALDAEVIEGSVPLDAHLPRPDQMEALGRALVEQALPFALRQSSTVQGVRDDAALVVAQAALLIKALPQPDAEPNSAEVEEAAA